MVEFETDINENIFVRVDRTRKVPATVLIRALGYGQNAQILDLFENDKRIQITMEKDSTDSEEEALVEIYKGCAREPYRRFSQVPSVYPFL